MELTKYITSEFLMMLFDLCVAAGIYSTSVCLIHCFFDDGVMLTKNKFLVSCILLTCAETLNVFVPNHFGVVVCYLLLGGVTLWKTKGRPVQRFFLLTVCFAMLTIVIFTLVQMCFYCFGLNGLGSGAKLPLVQYGISNAAMMAFLLLLDLYMYKQYISRNSTLMFRMQDKVLTFFYCIYMAAMLGVFTELEEDQIVLAQDNREVRVIFMTITITAAMLIPILILRNRQTDYYNKLSEQHENFLEAELKASKQYREAQEETIAFRHDIQNNLNAVAVLMKEGKYKEAEHYLDEMRTEVSALSPKVITGDEMLDSLISSKLTKLSEQEIGFTINGIIDGGLDWKPTEICSVFANALDNAIEACRKVEVPAERFIELNFKKSRTKRLISIINSTADEIDCDRLLTSAGSVTTKKDKQLHGYGIKNIRKVIEKHDGMMQLSCENGRFIMEFILTLPQQLQKQ